MHAEIENDDRAAYNVTVLAFLISKGKMQAEINLEIV
jgi:hypothetical protein